MTYLFDQSKIKTDLTNYFTKENARLRDFGNSVNQTFEAYVFTGVIKWYKSRKWKVIIVNPTSGQFKNQFRLKFTTRGAPVNFSYAEIKKGNQKFQIRHQLRISTKSYKTKNIKSANICCDVAIIENLDLTNYKTYFAVPNNHLIAFGEAKHMSAYAELIASFIGMVHELTPTKLKRTRTKKWKRKDHISPFLYVSGNLYSTAEGLLETIIQRKYDLDIYSHSKPLI
ncbi:hypothetical protein [Leptospira kanakyensis]|uniref:hypothetical protein n=1 Tax=Leptospira kanakyensis TaxID=2484968 RepID=UPI00223CE9C6|nr:hypothetical protein [Leptospira kanakyensis]MCW7471746.1 hypothetical protein [Leptospira kanakyensis]